MINFVIAIANFVIMEKLTKYSNFEELKLDNKMSIETASEKNKLMQEFEDFLTLLQREFSIQQKKIRQHESN